MAKMKLFSIWLPESLKFRLKKVCDRHDLKMADVIRLAILKEIERRE